MSYFLKNSILNTKNLIIPLLLYIVIIFLNTIISREFYTPHEILNINLGTTYDVFSSIDYLILVFINMMTGYVIFSLLNKNEKKYYYVVFYRIKYKKYILIKLGVSIAIYSVILLLIILSSYISIGFIFDTKISVFLLFKLYIFKIAKLIVLMLAYIYKKEFSYFLMLILCVVPSLIKFTEIDGCKRIYDYWILNLLIIFVSIIIIYMSNKRFNKYIEGVV